MKHVCVFAASAIVFALAAAQVRSAGPTVVVVSLQRVATESNAGKRASQQLETLRQNAGGCKPSRKSSRTSWQLAKNSC